MALFKSVGDLLKELRVEGGGGREFFVHQSFRLFVAAVGAYHKGHDPRNPAAVLSPRKPLMPKQWSRKARRQGRNKDVSPHEVRAVVLDIFSAEMVECLLFGGEKSILKPAKFRKGYRGEPPKVLQLAFRREFRISQCR